MLGSKNFTLIKDLKMNQQDVRDVVERREINVFEGEVEAEEEVAASTDRTKMTSLPVILRATSALHF